MDSAGGHSTSINNGVGSSSGRADACNTEEGSAALSGAATQHCDYKSSPAPFMTNPNYRIIPPTPSPDSAGNKPSGFSQTGTSTTAAASTRMSAWVSPTIAGAGFGGSEGNAMQVDDAQELRTEYDVLP
ncbi:hypothetical protein GGI24_006680, partial [Coemansia furcata]